MPEPLVDGNSDASAFNSAQIHRIVAARDARRDAGQNDASAMMSGAESFASI
jgi:hypothetical protein